MDALRDYRENLKTENGVDLTEMGIEESNMHLFS